MPPLFATSGLHRAIVIAGLALLAPAGLAAAAVHAPPDVSTDLAGPSDDGVALALAQDRSARADAIADSLKRSLGPAHFADLTPEADRAFGLDMVRADYADIQRKVASYRATLGDQHPTLVAAEQVMADIRGQLLDAIKRGLITAQRNAAEARSDVGVIERRIAARSQAAAARAGDVTGSVRPSPSSQGEGGSPALDPTAAADRSAGDEPVQSELPDPPPAPSHRLSRQLMGAAVGVLALLIVAWSLRQMVRGRRGARVIARRIEPALDERERPDEVSAEGVARPSEPPPEEHEARQAGVILPLPVVATLPLPADVGSALTRVPERPLARAADGLHRTLRAACGANARMTVLLSPVDGLPAADIDGAAIAIALAAVAAGRSALLMEARPGGRLRRGLVASGTSPMLIEVGGTIRTLYPLEIDGLTVAVLPSDAGEAEAALAADRRPETVRLDGLAAFDTVLVTGDAPAAGALARGADVALLVAPASLTAADLATAAKPLRATSRPCGALLIEHVAVASLSDPAVPARQPSAPRRRIASDTAAPSIGSPMAPLGLRGSFEPGRLRRGA